MLVRTCATGSESLLSLINITLIAVSFGDGHEELLKSEFVTETNGSAPSRSKISK